MPLARAILGLRTIVRRRGVGYVGYLITGVLLPRLAYRWCWGPSAPNALRRGFDYMSRLMTRTVRPERLGALGIEAPRAGDTVDVPPAAAVEALLNRAHAAGVTGLRHSLPGLVVAGTGTAEAGCNAGLRQHRRRGVWFMADRDADRRACNARFGTSLLTEEEARALLRHGKNGVTNGYRDYAPIDFGGGLTIGPFVRTDSGTGRWDFFNRHVVAPLVERRRVLDLGSNNGSLPLMMLRAGARAVVAIEGDPAIAEFARLNMRILGWRDLQSYDVRVIAGDMRQFLDSDLGRFDVITAFCSLYYLPEGDMGRIIEKAAGMRATLVLQANDSITNLPARAPVLEALMRRHGYSTVEVHRYPGFGRPILVGSAQPAVVGLRGAVQPQVSPA